MKEQEILLAEIVVKVSAIERLLIKSKIINAEELVAEMKKISDEVLKIILAQKS